MKKQWRGGLFPKKLSECTQAALKPALKQYGAAEARLLTHWPQIVGPVLAKVTVPQRIVAARHESQGNTLKLLVQNGWAAEVQHQEPMILEKIAVFFGYPAIARIALQQTYFPEDEKKAAPIKKTTKPASLPEVTDPELRAALEALGGHVAASGK